jgi:hypothetical protein
MKKLFSIIKSNLLLIAFLSFSTAWAQSPVGVVRSVKGNVFSYTNGKMSLLKVGSELYHSSEVVTEEGAQVSLADYFDHHFHLAGSGHVSLGTSGIELKSGYLWVQSYGQTNSEVSTAASVAKYSNGEFIVSFDSRSGKSQLLVIKGEVNFANSLRKEVSTSLNEGQFSFITNDYQNGLPRNPTPIGFSSYKKVTSLFDGVTEMDESAKLFPTGNSRTIASVSDTEPLLDMVPEHALQQAPVKEQGTIVIRSKGNRASSQKLIDSYMSSKLSSVTHAKPKKSKRVRKYRKKSGVKLKVFGRTAVSSHTAMRTKSSGAAVLVERALSKIRKSTHSASRAPASVPSYSGTKSSGVQKLDRQFQKSLLREEKKQLRHKKEVNELINDLESYNMDYKTSY